MVRAEQWRPAAGAQQQQQQKHHQQKYIMILAISLVVSLVAGLAYFQPQQASIAFLKLSLKAASKDQQQTGQGGLNTDWVCLSTCCWRRRELQHAPCQGDTPHNATGMEIIHTGAFKTLADIISNHPGAHPVEPFTHNGVNFGPNITTLTNRTAPCLQPSTVVFVESHQMERTAATLVPLISAPFILVTHGADDVLPGNRPWARTLLEDPRLLHWYAMSCISDHPKLSCLPLGVSMWRTNAASNNQFYMADLLATGQFGLADSVQPSRLHPKPRDKRMLVNFNVNNFPTRPGLYDLTCNSSANPPLRNISTCTTYGAPGVTITEFYKTLAQHRFVLAPRGGGPDTYRLWETLLLGSYPIVSDEGLSHLYAGLPVLVLKNLSSDITAGLLDAAYDVLHAQAWDYRKLYLGHYLNLVYQHRFGPNKLYKFEYKDRL